VRTPGTGATLLVVLPDCKEVPGSQLISRLPTFFWNLKERKLFGGKEGSESKIKREIVDGEKEAEGERKATRRRDAGSIKEIDGGRNKGKSIEEGNKVRSKCGKKALWERKRNNGTKDKVRKKERWGEREIRKEKIDYG
jgi:hypothetical protein